MRMATRGCFTVPYKDALRVPFTSSVTYYISFLPSFKFKQLSCVHRKRAPRVLLQKYCLLFPQRTSNLYHGSEPPVLRKSPRSATRSRLSLMEDIPAFEARFRFQSAHTLLEKLSKPRRISFASKKTWRT